ncbi:MAG TPA: RNA methyltransferase [Puia sp.]|jgi:TrmH family RNA methyltransferase
MLVKSQVKYIQSLGHKKFRDAEGVFVAEGPRMVQELLHCEFTALVKAYATRDWLLENASLIPDKNSITEVDQQELERISFLSAAVSVLAVFRKPVFPVMDKPEGITLLLDNIQDPGNLGTIIRTADWFGVRRIVCSPDTADLFSPKVVQSTMGSITRVEVLYQDLTEYLDAHPGIPAYAAMLDGEDLEQLQRIPEGMILIGNESRGVRPELAERAGRRIRIPGRGSAESLNVAVATGILLFMIQKS